MVNVGGRSKGCSNCRRRRVKCDENRPVCNRCRRCGFECEGPTDITFVEAKIVKSRRTIKPDNVPTGNDSGSTTPAGGQIVQFASMKGLEPETYICYSRKYFSRGAAIDLALQRAQLGDIVTAASVASNDSIFQQAVLSFSTIIFGAQHRQDYIARQGYINLGATLKDLNQALSHPKCSTRNDLILSIAVLAILESVVPTRPKTYMNHMLGLERLLDLRNVDQFSDPESSKIYRSVRHMMLFASLRAGKPSILARPEWKKALREGCTVEEMQQQDLFDILADCTVLASQRDSMLAAQKWDEAATLQCDEILKWARTLLAQLGIWRTKWEADERNSYVQSSVTWTCRDSFSEACESDFRPEPAVYEFTTLYAAIMLMFYNTTLIYVLRILISLPFQPAKKEYLAMERSAALEICRCVPYYSLEQPRSATENPVIHWAVTTAWTTLSGDDSPEGKWMKVILNTKGREVTVKGIWAGSER